MKAIVNCGACGAPASWPDKISDHDEVKCEACGETIATYYREILDAVEAAAVKKINNMLSGVLTN